MTRYAIVPVEATQIMRDAGYKACDDGYVCPSVAYTAMLAAAPNPLEDAEMVERVAMAIAPSAWETWEAPLGESYRLVLWEEEQSRARNHARAALAAIGGK